MLDQRFKKRISKIKSANKAFSFVARIKESKMGKDISKTSSPVNLDNLSINTLRFLSIDAIQKTNSGHPGLPMGAAAFAYVLWTRFLKHNQTPGDKRLPGHDCERPP